MSLANPAALFSLVSADQVASLDSGIDYTSGSTSADYPEEIRLVDPNGEPCATLVGSRDTSLDYRHEYVNGNIGDTKRMLRNSLSIAVDYIGDDVHQRLDYWARTRRQVLVNPGYGATTEFALRPVPSARTTDLTGRYTIAVNEMSSDLIWDDISMSPGYMRNGRTVRTPWGAGYVHESARTNLADPPYPTGSTDALSGWLLGATSPSPTRIYWEHGFGATDCPGALQVTGSFAAAARYIYRTTTTPSGAGVVWVTVFVRGKMGVEASLTITNGANQRTVYLTALDLSTWTPIRAALYATFSGTTTITINCIDTTSGAFNFYLGPTLITWNADSTGTPAAFPNWQPLSTTGGDHIGVTGLRMPTTGSIVLAFYVPDFFAATLSPMLSEMIYREWTEEGRLYLKTAAGSSTTQIAWRPYPTTTLSADVSLVAGAVNTIAIVYDDSAAYLYYNGSLVDSTTVGSELTYSIDDAATTSFFGRAGISCWPMVPLSVRMDNELYSADEIADLHASLTMTTVIQMAVAARGRRYRIRSVPSTPEIVAGATRWSGVIELEQVYYDATLADATSLEP